MKGILETERLALGELSLDEDLDFVATMLGDPEVMRFYPKALTRDQARAWIERQLLRYREHGHSLWLAVEKATGARVGTIGLVPQLVDGVLEPEIGYLLHRPFWHRGLATEAASGVRDHAFGPLGRRYVISLIRPENTPSRAVAARLGMAPSRETDFHGHRHLVYRVERPATETPRP